LLVKVREEHAAQQKLPQLWRRPRESVSGCLGMERINPCSGRTPERVRPPAQCDECPSSLLLVAHRMHEKKTTAINGTTTNGV
jgi:hypothetical protein